MFEPFASVALKQAAAAAVAAAAAATVHFAINYTQRLSLCFQRNRD